MCVQQLLRNIHVWYELTLAQTWSTSSGWRRKRRGRRRSSANAGRIKCLWKSTLTFCNVWTYCVGLGLFPVHFFSFTISTEARTSGEEAGNTEWSLRVPDQFMSYNEFCIQTVTFDEVLPFGKWEAVMFATIFGVFCRAGIVRCGFDLISPNRFTILVYTDT